ncbi:hypothetical protein Zmor_017342 [Zophobas morio]|uniref:Uncharacterized protein n=1 Tax=Zophobas morio TaxID=2755281 RepID=A0AA38MCK6_9CUCU|nr:hypothetical protein Zmor_017342 [Zophobas morio]
MARAKMACAKVSLRQVGFAPKWLAPSRPRQVGRAKSAAPNSPIPRKTNPCYNNERPQDPPASSLPRLTLSLVGECVAVNFKMDRKPLGRRRGSRSPARQRERG